MSDIKGKVVEVFYSLQGEGPSRGTPSVFIRFAGCNLNCGSSEEATWVCDSVKLWRDTKVDKITPKELFEKVNQLPVPMHAIMTGHCHIVFTGGEPALPKNARFIIEFIKLLNKISVDIVPHDPDPVNPSSLFHYNPYFEIETNGTIWDEKLFSQMHQINCSPKLSNSGVKDSLRINEEFLVNIGYNKRIHPLHKNPYKPAGFWFKFVIEGKEKEWEEILTTYGFYLPLNRIIFMPAGMDRETVLKNYKAVWELGAKYWVSVSNRDHIMAYDTKVGV